MPRATRSAALASRHATATPRSRRAGARPRARQRLRRRTRPAAGTARTRAGARQPRAPPLPPVPLVDGPLAIRVVYPRENQVVTSRDSNFIFGSIGSGTASLTVNGVPARVYPNGAFIVFLANPPADSRALRARRRRAAPTPRARHAHIAYPARVAAQPRPRRPRPTPPPPAKPEALATSRADTIAALNRAPRLAPQPTLTRDEPIGCVQLGEPSAAADTDRVIIGAPDRRRHVQVVLRAGHRRAARRRARAASPACGSTGTSTSTSTPPTRASLADTARRRAASCRTWGARRSATATDVVIPIGAARAVLRRGDGPRASRSPSTACAATPTSSTTPPPTAGAHGGVGAGDRRARARTVNLRAAPYGYLVLWENSALVLQAARPPAHRSERVRCAGLTIAVDPGHPPIGATGPTGLWEPQATLADRLAAEAHPRGARRHASS